MNGAVTTHITLTGPKTPREKAMEKTLQKQDVDQNIQVFLRCRPLNCSRQPPEKRAPLEIDRIRREVKVNEKNVDKGTRSFFFDDVFDPSVGQCEVYDGVVKPLVHEVLQGYNCTVFAYGQTGTGKTYTMEGSRSDYECSWQDDPKAGIVPRALDQLFEALSERGGTEHTISVSYMELYNENLYDLLSPCSDLVKLNIYEDNMNKGKVKVGGLAEVSVAKKDEIFDILRKGSAKRQTAATKLNACSSRSHTIFSVTVRMKDIANLMDGEEIYRIGKLNLVDLAGSENIGRSGAIEKRATEAGNINKSLLTLGRVITCLVEKQSHIPYRESKLTRLLQDSLGGRTKTSIIATISPSALDLEDTLSTLEYAQRAKKITNKPELNQKLTKNTVLKELTAEIERLRRDVDASRGAGNAFFIAKENYDSMSEQIERQTKDLEDRERQLHNLEEELERVKVLFGETQANLEKKTEQLHEVRSTLHSVKETLAETRNELTNVTRDRDEQKHLVDVHVKTERELGSQARVLLDVANISTNHVEKLHQKVDRVKQIEESNLKAASSFYHNFKDGMQNLANCVKNLDDGQYEELQSSLESKLTSLHSTGQVVNDGINSMSSSLASRMEQMKNSYEKDTLASDLHDLGKKIEETNKLQSDGYISLENQIDLTRKENKKHYTTLNELSLNHRAVIEEKVLEISSHLFKGKEMSVEDRTTLAQQMGTIFTLLADKIDSLQNQLNDSHGKMEQVRSTCFRSRSDFHKKLDSFGKQTDALSSNFCTLKDEIIEKLNRVDSQLLQMRQLHSQLVTEHETLHSSHHESAGKCLSLVSGAKSECGLLVDHCKQSSFQLTSMVDAYSTKQEAVLEGAISSMNELDQTHSKHFQDNIDGMSQGESAMESALEELASAVDRQKGSMKEELARCIIGTSNLAAVARDAAVERSAGLTSLSEQVASHANDLCCKLASHISDIADGKESLVNDVTLLKVRTKMAQKNLLKGLDDRSSEVKSLVHSGLKKDVPTGQTPMKTPFNYPTNLTQTSPHERVLARFRQTLENMKPE